MKSLFHSASFPYITFRFIPFRSAGFKLSKQSLKILSINLTINSRVIHKHM